MVFERIRNLREDRDWSQEYVAKILCISQRCYSHYENGERGLPTDILIKLADIYNTSTDYILNRTDNSNPIAKQKSLQK